MFLRKYSVLNIDVLEYVCLTGRREENIAMYTRISPLGYLRASRARDASSPARACAAQGRNSEHRMITGEVEHTELEHQLQLSFGLRCLYTTVPLSCCTQQRTITKHSPGASTVTSLPARQGVRS